MIKQIEYEFKVGDIVHKPHEDYKDIFCPMVVTRISHEAYYLESKDRSFPWITLSSPLFIKESKYFGKFKDNGTELINKEYQAWIELLAGGSK